MPTLKPLPLGCVPMAAAQLEMLLRRWSTVVDWKAVRLCSIQARVRSCCSMLAVVAPRHLQTRNYLKKTTGYSLSR
jgi:hypothetical protein